MIIKSKEYLALVRRVLGKIELAQKDSELECEAYGFHEVFGKQVEKEIENLPVAKAIERMVS